MDAQANTMGTLKSRYESMSRTRNVVLERARTCSKYTLPNLLPPEGSTETNKLKVTYSSFGARCVNSLTAKLTLALFPPRAPFFRLTVPDEVMEKLGPKSEVATAVEEALGKMEQRVTEEIETSMARATSVEAVKHLIVAGNVLVYLQPDNALKVFAISNYVCKRDPEGNLLAAIAQEKLSAMEVSQEVRDQIAAQDPKKVDSPDDTLTLHTGVFRTASGYEMWQEVEGIRIEESYSTYPRDKNPWMALRWGVVYGEDYGRGLVEEYIGDLISEEGLSAAIVKGAAAAAKLVFLVKPGVTKKATIARANTGDVVDGNPDDVGTLQSQHSQDFRVAFETRNAIQQSLSYAFLLNQAIQRDAERVTAEEIRFMANELDSSLGGIYSSLSLEFQLPYLRGVLAQMQRQGKLPQLPKGSIRPVITTGIEALGRGAELGNLQAFVKDVVELGGPEALNTYLNFDDLLKRLATARNLKIDGLVKTADEVAAANEQAQQAAMMQTLGPNAVNQVGGIVKESMKEPTGG
jgi:hypothetical protein